MEQRLGAFFVFVVIACIGVGILDRCSARRVPIGDGLIVAKTFTPSTSSSGTGTGIDANGNLTTVFTNDYTAEKWTVVVMADGHTESVTVDPDTWGSLAVGSHHPVYRLTGKLMTYGLAF